MRFRRSYGIICCRPGKQGTEIMMIKKSTTYHFCEFVAGHYHHNSKGHLMKLFNNMTHHEKVDILSLQFSNMWYRIYMENPDKIFLQNSKRNWASAYFRKKGQFETNFLPDSGRKLRNMISRSTNVDTPWEFPKGRQDAGESDIETAIREFCEETGVSDNQFKILWHLKPYVETYTDFGTIYQNIYYFATAVGEWDPVYTFYDKRQMSEVSDIRWVNKTNLKHMNLEPMSLKRMLVCFSKIIKKYKNAVKKNEKIISKKLKKSTYITE